MEYEVDKEQFPYYHLVPKDIDENLDFRLWLVEEGCKDPEFAADIYAMCARDPLFFMSCFVYCYDPRSSIKISPFIPYEFQEVAVSEYCKSLGKEDIFTDKSRDMGASWLHLILIDWMFLFQEMSSILCVSRVEDLVDKKDDPDSLFWKIDFIHKNLPPFLRPPAGSEYRKMLHFYNPNTGSTINGCSTNDDVGRGGRRTVILLDEFAAVPNGYSILNATQATTNCRMFNSTPKGVGNAFHAMYKTGIKKIRLHWANHPEKNRGLYKSNKGKLDLMDKTFDWALHYPEGYNYILDGKIRSPWYDAECLRASHPMEIAQELDIDYLGSDFQFFDPTKIQDYIKKYACDPLLVGEISFDVKEKHIGGFSAVKGGRLALWVELDENGKPPASKYAVACDIASGTGSSNSIASIGDLRTGRKIGEFASPYLQPYEFAEYVWAFAKFFDDAFVIWENNGPGRNFGATLTGPEYEDKLCYGNVYFRNANDESMDRRMTAIPGWASTGQTKKVMLSEYRKSLESEDFINPSYEGLNECLCYVYTATGYVAHANSLNTLDPSGARDNHGDRVIADGLLSKVCRERMVSVDEVKKQVIPDDCFYARQQKRKLAGQGMYNDGWRIKWSV